MRGLDDLLEIFFYLKLIISRKRKIVRQIVC